MIAGILVAAKELNCVAYHTKALEARHGGVTGAPEATRAAIHDIQIKTRRKLVRDQVQYQAIFNSFQESVRPSGLSAGPGLLDLHLKNLKECLSENDLDETS